MATPEQKAASRAVMDAVTALNRALRDAGSEGLHVELQNIHEVNCRNPLYIVQTIEVRETVLP